jgi:hypothetical protein
MPQYISDNTDDEMSHAAFLNASLIFKGEKPVDLDAFRTLPSSQATGALALGRLTNLMNLNVDTSWYTRYRSTPNPDLGATFPHAVNIVNEPAVPLNDQDTPPNQPQPVPPTNAQQARMQAIANTAGFHFAIIEQGGSSLYTVMAQKVTNAEVLRIECGIAAFGGRHGSGNGIYLPGPERFSRRRALPDQPDPAGTMRVPQPEVSGLFGDPAFLSCQRADTRRASLAERFENMRYVV